MLDYDFSQLKQSLEETEKVAIFLSRNLDVDLLGAGLALSLSLEKIGKQVEVFCSQVLTVEFNRLIGVETVKQEAIGSNLVIAFEHLAADVENIRSSIHPKSGNLEIIVKPIENKPMPDFQKIRYFYQGIEAEMVFGIGVKDQDDLGHFASDAETVINKVGLLRIDNQTITSFTEVEELVDRRALTISEVVYGLLYGLSLPINEDIASNLLAGIEMKTGNLTRADITPELLETTAACMRAGGVRGYVSESSKFPDGIRNGAGKVQSSKLTTERNQDEVVGEEKVAGGVPTVQGQVGVDKVEDFVVGNGQVQGVNLPLWMMPKL